MTPTTLFPLGQPAFVAHPLDRAAHLRTDPQRLMALEEDPRACAYLVYRDSIIARRDGEALQPRLALAEARDLGANPGTVFLGLRRDAPVFGMGITADAAELLLARRDVMVGNIRALVTEGTLALEDLSAIAVAKSLVNWHQRHGFCANCGTRTRLAQAGWRRDCPSCNAEHFPRTDPVVIMMVTEGERCLLGRQPHFAPGMWSCLAGFVEAAETIEDAVRREVLEETGIRCTDVSYTMTQPWPYPSSMMIGCAARALSHEIVVDRSELEDARWFDRAEVALMLAHRHPDGHTGPHPFAVAHHLLGGWALQGAAGTVVAAAD
jgi:NAD+ diphosphatase